jgi:hypothetical protein
MTRTLIPERIPLQIRLVILLGTPPLARRRDLGHDAAAPPLLVGLGRHLPGDALLLLVVEVDGRAVLGSRVGTLAVEGRGVVGAVEEFEELAVGDLGRVEDDLRCLGVFFFEKFLKSVSTFGSKMRDGEGEGEGEGRTTSLSTAHGAV